VSLHTAPAYLCYSVVRKQLQGFDKELGVGHICGYRSPFNVFVPSEWLYALGMHQNHASCVHTHAMCEGPGNW